MPSHVALLPSPNILAQLVLPASTSLVSSFPPGDVSLPNVTWALNTLDPDALIPFTVHSKHVFLHTCACDVCAEQT
jgi:hypothetical protein